MCVRRLWTFICLFGSVYCICFLYRKSIFVSYHLPMIARMRTLKCQFTMALDESPLHLWISFMIVVVLFSIFIRIFQGRCTVCNRSCTLFFFLFLFSLRISMSILFSLSLSGWPLLFYKYISFSILLSPNKAISD